MGVANGNTDYSNKKAAEIGCNCDNSKEGQINHKLKKKKKKKINHVFLIF